MIGDTVARELFGAQAARSAQWLRIGDARCRVIGVLAQQGLSGGFNVDEMVILPVATAQQIFNTLGRVPDPGRGDEPRLRAGRRSATSSRLIKARHAGEEDITVVTQDALVSTFDTIFGMITAGLAAIAAISLVVAGVLIMNVMLVAVSQRTAEIGLLKAVGARNRQIIALFLAEAALPVAARRASSGSRSAVGGIVGAALSRSRCSTFRRPRWASCIRRRRRDRERTRVRHPAGASCRGPRPRAGADETLTPCAAAISSASSRNRSSHTDCAAP